jgi:hypothetical protein
MLIVRANWAAILSSNGNVDAGLEGAAFAVANYGIGYTFQEGQSSITGQAGWNATQQFAGSLISHAVLGCVQAEVGGSRCGAGVLMPTEN